MNKLIFLLVTAAIAAGVTNGDAFAQAWPAKPVHLVVPYTPGAITDVLAQSGRLKAIAASSTTRVAQAPEVRTIAEQGYPGFDMMSWTGLLAPVGTPTEVVARLASETQAILAAPEAKERLLKLGLESPPVVSPAAFAGQVKTDVAKWTKVIRDANIKPE